MLYETHEAQAAWLDLMRPFAAFAAAGLRLPWPLLQEGAIARRVAGAFETFAGLSVSYKRPSFKIDSVPVGNRLVPVVEEVVHTTPFGTLLRFKKDIDVEQPRVLVVAPMSGHFATLLRNTVETILRDHDVYITDWHNVRDVPLDAGRFDLAAFVDHIIGFLAVMGPGSHVVAVCQPCVPVLAAAALMAEDGHAAQPRSLTLMAGPIDTRINPTKVNDLAVTKPIDWFEKNLTSRVPYGHKGARRRVYPGFMQLTAFMTMNIERHLRAFGDLAEARATGDMAKAKAMQDFYEEYFAVMDLPAEFYLETVRAVFQDYDLARGELVLNGRKVDPRAIRRMGLLTVEGERDDICGLGQTLAAQDLCPNVRPYLKVHHVQTGVGHYGVFSGRRWAAEIYPKLRDMVQMAS